MVELVREEPVLVGRRITVTRPIEGIAIHYEIRAYCLRGFVVRCWTTPEGHAAWTRDMTRAEWRALEEQGEVAA